MKIVITGGAGFIGSNIARRLLERSSINEILLVDNLSSDGDRRVVELVDDKRVSLAILNIEDLDSLTKAFSGADLVIHLAANPDIAKALKDPTIDFWQGTYLTQNVLEAMRLSGVKRIVYSSGSGVYGEVPGERFREDFGPCQPISGYGASKLASEVLISSYCHMFDLRARIFRFANVVGPNQTHGVTYDFIRKLRLQPNQLEVLGDGSQTKSYIHVEDVISALSFILESIEEEPVFDIYNVSVDDQVSVADIAELAVKEFHAFEYGKNLSKTRIVYGTDSRGWRGDVPRIQLDSGKLRALGWQETFSSRSAIISAIQSVLKETS